MQRTAVATDAGERDHAGTEPGDGGAREHSEGVMANSRTTYQDRSGGDGATASGVTFVWVSLRDPSPEELASVQREFGLPGPLVEQLGAVTKRPALEVVGELLFAVVKTVRWAAAEEEISSGEVQLVLGHGFVVSVDRDAAVLEQVRQDLQADPELVGAGLAAVLPCVVDHAAKGYGPVLRALNNAVEEVAEAVFSPAEPRPTERIYRLSRQLLEFRRAGPRSPSCSTAWPPTPPPPPASGSSSAIASGAPTCSIWSSWPTASATCSPTCSRPT
jgi:Mg2+ and Co2+ transporter CorA